MTRAEYFVNMADKRVLLLDGAMGTMIQRLALVDGDLSFGDLPPAKGCNDLLCLTRGDLVHDIHLAYLKAGADIVETNTFGANRFSLAEYGLSDYVFDINLAAVEVAKSAVEEIEREDASRFAFVAGVVGPTGKAASFSPSVDDPAYREVVFGDFVDMYTEQISALIDGGVDLLLIETVFDTLVAKAALVAAVSCMEERGISLPIMVSATFSDRSGRTLSGQTLEALVDTLSPFPLFSLGVNCSTGPEEMIPLIRKLAEISPFRTSAHPNAGFPDNDGNYSQSPAHVAALLDPIVREGLLNIVGGCCGTTPDHIAHLAKVARDGKPRSLPRLVPRLRLSGLEPLSYPKPGELLAIGERTNVAGSKKFARLVKDGKFDQALAIARTQIEQGAGIIDICMDDSMLDASVSMVRFVRLASADPEIAKVPFMIDSSSWEVVVAALPELQGRGIVNSISLKEGPEVFVARAKHIASMGAAMVVMLFDETGQADTFERKCQVAERSYRLLVDGGVCDPASIVFDPNVLAIATGIDEHDRYASDFIRATAWIKNKFPQVSISGGISNLSFSFRGNNAIREAIHAIFLAYAVDAGLDMAIVNPAALIDPASIPPHAATVIEHALLAEGESPATDRDALIALAMQPLDLQRTPHGEPAKADSAWRSLPVDQRLAQALLRGDDSHLANDLVEAGDLEAVQIIEGPLMGGMAHVGKLFGEGKLFLPQVVRSARVMKRAVDILQPRLEAASSHAVRTAGTIVLATVKGDVHDIGKNIVSLVLKCNNFTIVDLGVMVPPQDILAAAKREHADIVGLSGLITPSLAEMAHVCRLFQEDGLDIPIMIGGATTSEEYTALRLDPLYPGQVFHSTDASHAVSVALKLMSSNHGEYRQQVAERYHAARSRLESNGRRNIISFKDATKRRFMKKVPAPTPVQFGIREVSDVTLEDLVPKVNWSMLTTAWKVPPKSQEAERLVSDAVRLLGQPEIKHLFSTSIKAAIGIFPADSSGPGIIDIHTSVETSESMRFLRSQSVGADGSCRSLADYIHPDQTDSIGMFVATTGLGIGGKVAALRAEGDEYHALLLTMVTDRLAEAFSELLHLRLASMWWGFGNVQSIRPAVGYPSAPDHVQKATIFSILDAKRRIGVDLTSGYAMDPPASVSGFYFVGEGCTYFSLGPLGTDQLADYAEWRQVPVSELERTMQTRIVGEGE